jgi:ABC-2 type transport system permease protein
MKGSVVRQLILKDWRLHSPVITLCVLGGGIALAILQLGGLTPFILGGVTFFISLIFCASLLPMSNIVNERKKQTLPFIMSLPISPIQYSIAKLVSSVGMFAVPWVILVAAGVWLIAVRHTLPSGVIPAALIIAALPFVGFCVITAMALLGETEGWGTAGIAIVNSSYWLVWYLLSTHTTMARDWQSPILVWTPTVLTILAVELAAIVAILGLTLYLQSRKRDFI